MRNAWRAIALSLPFVGLFESRGHAQASRGATAAFPSTEPSAPSTSGTPPPVRGPPPATTPAPVYYAPPPTSAPSGAYYYAPPPANPWTPPYYGSGPPRAAPPPGSELPYGAKETPPVRSVSLTVSPVLLVLPVLQLGIEVRPTNHLGLRALGGIGSLTHTSTVYGTRVTATYGVQEVGIQLHAYPLAAFDSLVLGAEFLYVHLSGGVPGTTITGIGSGTAMGPLIGYKLVTSGGFTLLASVGVGYIVAHGSASDSASGVSASSDDRRWQPFLNLDLGWSF